MLEEAKDAIFVGPAVVAMAVIAGQDGCGVGTNLFGRFETATGNTPLQRFHFSPDAVLRLGPLCPLESQALIGVDDEHAHARMVGGNLLNQRLWGRRFLSCRDAGRTFDPRPGRALDIVEHFTTASAVAAAEGATCPLLLL